MSDKTTTSPAPTQPHEILENCDVNDSVATSEDCYNLTTIKTVVTPEEKGAEGKGVDAEQEQPSINDLLSPAAALTDAVREEKKATTAVKRATKALEKAKKEDKAAAQADLHEAQANLQTAKETRERAHSRRLAELQQKEAEKAAKEAEKAAKKSAKQEEKAAKQEEKAAKQEEKTAKQEAREEQKPTITDNLKRLVGNYNNHFSHIANGGKNYVIRERNNRKGVHFDYFPLKEFRDLLLSDGNIQVGFDEMGRPAFETRPNAWLKSRDKKFYPNGVTFDPSTLDRTVEGMFNTYLGLSALPKPHDMNIIMPYLNHILNVICSSNPDHFRYVQGWIAHLFQRPDEKPGVAILLTAEQGTGKGAFVEPIGKLIGQHYFHATEPDAVLGKFNAHLENIMLLFADEFFGGSKAATDRLKGMVTEKTQKIERKGVDSFSTDSFSRLILSSNHENIVRIETSERRYFYLEVSSIYRQDHQYFGDLFTSMNHPDFLPMLLSYFLSVDLSGFNVRDVPKTEALNKQKIDNLETIDAFILHLIRGAMNGRREWKCRDTVKAVQDEYELWCTKKRIDPFGDAPTKLGIALTRVGVKKTRTTIDGKREYLYEFGELQNIIDGFNEHLGFMIDYDHVV